MRKSYNDVMLQGKAKTKFQGVLSFSLNSQLFSFFISPPFPNGLYINFSELILIRLLSDKIDLCRTYFLKRNSPAAMATGLCAE